MIDALRKISSPSLANAIETFNVRPRSAGFMSSEIRTLFPELGPLVGHAVTALIRAEPAPLPEHRASTFAWWDYVLSIPAPRVVVVHEAQGTAGFGGEIVARLADAAFPWLDAPIRRVTYPDRAVPFAKKLEQALIPTTDKVLAAARETLAY